MPPEQSEESDVRALPARSALLRLSPGTILSICAASVDRASWFAWRRDRNVKALRAVNSLVKLGDSVALNPKDHSPESGTTDRMRALRAVIADALMDADGATKAWLDSARLLARMIDVLCDRIPSTVGPNDELSGQVVKSASELLAAVLNALPTEVRGGWCSNLCVLVTELASRTELSKENERQTLALVPVAPHHLKLIGDRLVVRGGVRETRPRTQNRLTDRSDCCSIDTIPEKPTTSHQAILAVIAETERSVQAMLATLRTGFRKQVENLAGATFTTFAEKKECIERIKRLAAAFRMEFVFEGLPVSLQLVPDNANGAFRLLQKRKVLFSRAAFPPLSLKHADEEETRKRTKKT